MNTKIPKIRYLSPLIGTNPILYTADNAEIILDKQTGKKYRRGEGRVFSSCNEAIPPTIEDTDCKRWAFIRKNPKGEVHYSSSINYGRELFVQGLFRK